MVTFDITYKTKGFLVDPPDVDIYYGNEPEPVPTSPFNYLVVNRSSGGVGIIGMPQSPDLRAFILGEPRGISTDDLRAIIVGTASGVTSFPHIILANGSIVLITETNSPDLAAVIQAFNPYESAITAVYTPQFSGSQNLTGSYSTQYEAEASLSGSIHGFEEFDLSGYYTAALSGAEMLPAEYFTTDSGTQDLAAAISGLVVSDLQALYLVLYSGTLNIGASISGVEPIELGATISGFDYAELAATVSAVLPSSLLASVTGLGYLNLLATIKGEAINDLGAEYSPVAIGDLYGLVLGTASGTQNLAGQYTGFVGIEQLHVFPATISGVDVGTKDLTSSIAGHLPSNISGTISGVPPVDLQAAYTLAGAVEISSTISGEYPPDSLIAEISSQGGFLDLSTYVIGAYPGEQGLTTVIDGNAVADLLAEINGDPSAILTAMYNYFGTTPNTGLGAKIFVPYEESLSASYDVQQATELPGVITAIEPAYLQALITPKVYYIDSSIPINTYPLQDLRAVINLSPCEPRSAFSELQVMISGILNEDIQASYVGLAGQLAWTENSLDILIRQAVSIESWVPIIIDHPIISEAYLPITLTNAPTADLIATITAVQPNTDLKASISSRYYSNVPRDSATSIQWYNKETGERKLVELSFVGEFNNFYYSAEANDTIAFSPDDYIRVRVTSYVPQASTTFLSPKSEVSECFVDRLTDFSTIDEAIRYAIVCSLSEIHEELRATITAVGASTELGATIQPLSNLTQKQLTANYTPVTEQPILTASISGSGGFEDLRALIRSSLAAQTGNPGFVDTMGERYLPRLVVHGSNQASIVLTKVVSTDILVTSSSPDLRATIVGELAENISATISGS